MAVVNDIQKLEKAGYTVEQAIEIIKAKELRDIKELGEKVENHLVYLTIDMGIIRVELVDFFTKILETPEEQREEAMKEMLRRLFGKVEKE